MAKTINKTPSKPAINQLESLVTAIESTQRKLDKLRISELQKNQKALTRAQSQWRKAKQAVSAAKTKQQATNKKHKTKPTAATLKQIGNAETALLKAEQQVEVISTEINQLKTDCETLKQAITKQKAIAKLVSASLKTKTTQVKKTKPVKAVTQAISKTPKPVTKTAKTSPAKKIKPKASPIIEIEPAKTIEPVELVVDAPQQTEIDLAVETPITEASTMSSQPTTNIERPSLVNTEVATTIEAIKEENTATTPAPETFNLFDH